MTIEELSLRYRILERNMNYCHIMTILIQDLKENLFANGRSHTKLANTDALNYLYCFYENLSIEKYAIEKQIVKIILKLIEDGKCLFTEFVPYKYSINSTSSKNHTKYLLCKNQGYYYLLVSSIPSEASIISINNDFDKAFDDFLKNCHEYIEIRKQIEARFDLTQEQRAKLEKIEFNDIPRYHDIFVNFYPGV